MKKKALFLTSFAVALSIGALIGQKNFGHVNADGASVEQRLQNLIASYRDEKGQYTKKTTICFNATAHAEMDKYFHCGQVQAKRTTYYDDIGEQLLMAEPDGTLDPSYGGYRLVKEAGETKGKIYRFASKGDTTLENMFDGEHINQQKNASYANKNHLSDAFVNLSKFLEDGYYTAGDWGYDENSKQFYHDLNIPAGKTENDDKYYPDILGFAAPMLKPNYVGSHYLHIKSIGFSEHYDTNALKYLSIKIYLDDVDSKKVTGECGSNTMSEARIYKGIRPIGEEDFTESFFLKVWDKNDNEVSSTKLTVNKDNKKEVYATKVAMNIDDHAKIWSTTREFGITSNFNYSHNLSVGVSTNGNGDYVAKNQGTYDFYAKFVADNHVSYDSTWVNMNETRTIYLENNKYWGSPEFRIHYWGGSGVTGTAWDEAPYFVYDSKTDKDIYRVTIPANTEKVIFRHCDIYGNSQSQEVTLGNNNAFYFASDNDNGWSIGSYKK